MYYTVSTVHHLENSGSDPEVGVVNNEHPRIAPVKDQYDNIVAMVTGMLCELPVTIYFKWPFILNNSFQNAAQPPIHNFMNPILVLVQYVIFSIFQHF